MKVLTRLEVEQIQHIIRNSIETRSGIVCLYKGHMLVADTAEELHEMLKMIWTGGNRG